MRLFAITLALLAYAGGCDSGKSAAAEPQVGLKPGDLMQAFTTKAITGPEKGKSLCYI